jgi:hypothetical protein
MRYVALANSDGRIVGGAETFFRDVRTQPIAAMPRPIVR